MNPIIAEWQALWGIPDGALDDLEMRLGMVAAGAPTSFKDRTSEAYVQSLVRLDVAPAGGCTLWRNNVGALTPRDSDRPVRFGLANDSKSLNETIKSGDLIGWRKLIITPAMVGSRIAQFASAECKHVDWVFGQCDPNSEQGMRERAQARWNAQVTNAGGVAGFTTGGLPW